MDYCMIVLEKIINPLTPENQIYPLLKDLMDCVPHLEMKALAQRIVDPSIDQAEKRRLMEEFRTFDHGGRNDFSEVDYCELMDKFLDPNLPDHEYKPTMKALIEGDLDQERKNQVSAIISCQDKEQKAKMVKRWKSSFEKEKEEKLQQEREIAAKRAEKKKKQNELKAKLENLLEFEDDGMTLIMRMLDKTIPADKKTEIYDRLMEPDVAADIKNLSIQLISLKKQSERVQRVEDFKKEREAEKIAQANRKVEAEKKRLEEEQAMKEVKMQRKKELLAKSNKDERMKKRDLMLKLRAKERMADEQSGYAGPSSIQERDEMRRRERERVRQEILRFREQSRKEMKRQEREDMRKEGWMVLPFETEKNYSVDVQVVVADLDKLLVGDDHLKFVKALANLKIKQSEDTNDTNKEKPKTAPPLPTESVQEQPDAEFDKYFKIFSDPNLTLEEEKGHFKKLIAESKSALVRKLVVKLATDVGPGVGKSAMFKALAKKFVTQAAAPALVQPMSTEPKPTEPVNISEEKNGMDKSSSESLPSEATKHSDDNDRTTAGIEEARPSSAASQNSQKSNKENKEDRKRNISGESVGSNASKKLKLHNQEAINNSNEKRQRSESPSSRSEKKKKKKHKKEKKHHKEKSRHKDKDNPKDENRITSPGHKSNDAPQDEENSLPSSLLQNGFDYKGDEPLTSDFTVNYSHISKFHLQKLNCYVKIKNQKKLYRAVLKQEEMRKLHQQSKCTTPVSRTPSPLTKTKSRSRSRSRSSSLASRSSSRSPVRFVSRTPSPARSMSRSLSRSLSRSRSRSRSRSVSS